MLIRDSLDREPSLFAPWLDPDAPEATGHFVQFYENDGFMVDTVARYVGSGLGAGDAAIVIATAAHRAALDLELSARGLDVASAHHAGRYVALDAAETLARFMIGGHPDPTRFEDVIGAVVSRAAAAWPRVLAFGEMVALLWQSGQEDAAIELEHLWNGLGERVRFSLLCAYHMPAFHRASDAAPFRRICDTHTRAVPAESYLASQSGDRLRAVVELQQQATALAGEVKRKDAAEHSLSRLHHEYSDLFENAAVALHCVGPDGVILRANKAELALLRYGHDEYVGRHVADFHVDQDVIADMLARLGRGETFHDQPVRLRRKDGSIIHALVDSNALWEGGKFIYTRCFTRDVTAAKEAEYAQRRLAAIVESSEDAIVGKTLAGIVTSWNRAAERMFGYSAEEMIGQPIARIVPPERRDEAANILATVRRGERVEHFESERVRKDGRRIQVSLTISPIRDGAGEIIGASKIARDISDQKLAERERECLLQAADQARADAEAANRAKDAFLSVVSHELRTPLASIMGWVTVLRNGVSGDRARRAIETIERSGRAQAKLIEDLVDASRMITGRMRLEMRAVDLPALLTQAAEAIRPTVNAKRVNLVTRLDSTATVVGDPERLQQIAWNLLSNAVKFTPSGGTVELTLERAGSDVRVAVRDTGRGIARDFLPFVFQRFRQADRVEGRRSGGLGLGLAIARHLVELHGGSIAATSDGEGLGATFTVTLPLAPDLSASAQGDTTRRLLARVHALVVDDDFDAQEACRFVLESQGARVTVAGSAEEARELLKDTSVDIVVSDIRLPGADGYALVHELRATQGSSYIPAIAVTGLTDPEDETRATQAGFDARLTKPFDPELLVGAVSQLAARTRAEHA